MNFAPVACLVCGRPVAEPRFRPFCSSTCGDDDLNRVRGVLLSRLEELADLLMGAPSVRSSRQWRWGSKGSVALEMRGRKRGLWNNHEAGVGGGPLQMVQHAHACSMGEAIRWARAWTGGATSDAPRVRVAQKDDAAELAERTRRIWVAQSLWRASSRAVGTLAETYLRITRGISAPVQGWPDAVRFHRASQSLIVVATTIDGEVRAVQRVRLSLGGTKATATPDQPTKTTNGVLAGAMMRLPGDATGPLVLAEGPETGLSVWAATGHETWTSLGNLKTAEPPTGRLVVIARDDDLAWSPADRNLRNLVEAWKAAGVRIVVASPWPQRHGDKSDFNDVLRTCGAEAVRQQIAIALAPTVVLVARRPISQARHMMGQAIRPFFHAAAAHDPEGDVVAPAHAVRVDVGSGKSFVAREGAVDLLTTLRSRGDHRSVAFAVPTHALGQEAAAEFEAMPAARAAGLTAAIWRGRRAANPDQIGQMMCLDLDRVDLAQAAGQSVQSACCKAKTELCPYFGQCGYQAQRQRKGDAWFLAHEMLFTSRPDCTGVLAALIVDESAWQDGVEGSQGRPISLALDALNATDIVPGDLAATDRLHNLRKLALTALRANPDGPVQRLVLAEMHNIWLTPADASEARKLEWRRKIDVEMHPAMTVAERRAAARAAEGNRVVGRLAMFWGAIEALLKPDGPDASGWAALGWSDTQDGRVRVLHLKGRKAIREGWEVPTLLIDATLQIPLVKPFWPNVELVADIAVETPHMRVRQVVDRSFSKRHLELHDDLSRDERRIRTRHLQNLNATLAMIGRSYAPGRTLVVAQKAIKEALPEVGMLPPSIELAHHNSVAGRDEWKDVKCLVVVGRTSPPPNAVARIAEALTGVAMPRLPAWYPKATSTREMTDGTTVPAECDRHPDPVCEAVRQHICEGELVQIVGRARGVNRGEADPVDVLVLTDVPLPLPLDATLAAAELDPSPLELMLGCSGIAFENATDAAAAYPLLWSNRPAADQALARAVRREKYPTFPYRSVPIRECRVLLPNASQIEYQRTGQGRTRSVAWFDANLVPDPISVLMAIVGPLAWCSIASTDAASGSAASAEDAERLPAADRVTVQPVCRADHLTAAPRREVRTGRQAADDNRAAS